MLALISPRTSTPAPLATPSAPALVLLRDPIEVGGKNPASPAMLADHATANHLQRIRHHPTTSLEGCLGFVLSSLKALGPASVVDGLTSSQALVLRSRGIASKDQLVDLLATAQAQDLLSTLIHGAGLSACSAPAGRDTHCCAVTLHSRPPTLCLPAFMRTSGQPPAAPRAVPRFAMQLGQALVGRSEVVRKAVHMWMDPDLEVPAGIGMHYTRLRLDEQAGQAGLPYLLAREDLADCIDRLRIPMTQHACTALLHMGTQAADAVRGLDRLAIAGRQVLGTAFALGKDEVQAELTARGGWASHSLLMGGLSTETGPERAMPALAPSLAKLVSQYGPGISTEAAATWARRAARVLCDVVRLATLLTVYDVWGVRMGPAGPMRKPGTSHGM